MSNQKDALATQFRGFREFMTRAAPNITAALPRHLNADRIIRLTLTAWSTTPSLQRCKPDSILASVIMACQMGLEIGVNGQGYLIAYGDRCTFVPGWKGLVALLNNTGRAVAWTGAVFEGDVWDFELGSSPRCRHIPGPNSGDQDKLIAFYAVGQVNGAQLPVVESWTIARVKKHLAKYNKVGEKHYALKQNTDNMEMYGRKVVLLQVLKYMPVSIELTTALQVANADDAGKRVTVEDGVVIQAEAGDIEAEEASGGTGTQQEVQRTRQEAAPKPKPAEDVPDSREAIAFISRMMTDHAFTFSRVKNTALAMKLVKANAPCTSLADFPDRALKMIADDWTGFATEVEAQPE